MIKLTNMRKTQSTLATAALLKLLISHLAFTREAQTLSEVGRLEATQPERNSHALNDAKLTREISGKNQPRRRKGSSSRLFRARVLGTEYIITHDLKISKGGCELLKSTGKR